MRTAWKGQLQFGLVVIPLRLGKATGDPQTILHMVHTADGGRIRFDRHCEACSSPVDWSDIGKGAERPDGAGMVVLTTEELNGLRGWEPKTIEVLHFTAPADVDALLRDGTYYVEPLEGAGRAYALLHQAMVKTKKAAVCRIAMRQTQHLALLEPRGELLLLTVLRWPSELRAVDVIIPAAPPRQQELKMAVSLVTQMTRDFDPAEHADSYRQAIGELVAAKAAVPSAGSGARSRQAQAAPAPDLTAMLEQSIQAVRDGAKPTRRRSTAKAS